MKRYLEIDHRGVAFHQPAIDSPLSMGKSTPPAEVLFCDCAGVGAICHHRYPAADGSPERHFSVHGPAIADQHQSDWKRHHAKAGCTHRRQIFVDVTHRPDAQLGMHYDEQSDTFSPPPDGKG